MDYSESIQTNAGSTNLKENTEIDNVVEKNDCDGESLYIVCYCEDITRAPFIVITLKKAENKFLTL
jgi:hypothetical protein